MAIPQTPTLGVVLGLLSSFGVARIVAQITVSRPLPAAVTVHVSPTGTERVSDTVFGSFLEPIGNSINNGIAAEILVNRSLEAGLWNHVNLENLFREQPELIETSNSTGIPLPWQSLNTAAGNRFELRVGEAANSWQSLEIMGQPDELTGIKQKVYLPVQRTQDYQGSLFAKHVSGPTGLTISIRKRNETAVLASAKVDAAAETWTRYSFELKLPEGALERLDAADFVVEVAGDERVDLDALSLMPADATGGLDPDMVAMAKAMKTPLVRFGGNFTSGYHWQDGVGPLDKRVSKLNIAWGIPELNTFGTDEFLHFCELIGAQPQVALNLGSGTPEEAGAWVKYVDEHWGDKQGGLTWELGNELWGGWNLGAPTLDQLAARTKAFSDAARAADPHARLIATGQDPDVYEKWNATQLTNPAGTFDFLSTHFVVTGDQTKLRPASPDFVAQATFALPVELGRKLRAMQAQIDGVPGFAGKAHVAFTEWLYVGNARTAPVYSNMGGAIGAAGFFNMLMRNADVVPISDMTGIIEFAGIWKKKSQVYGAPAYWAFRMYSNADATRPVAVETHAGTYDVHQGVGRLPEIAAVPYLDMVGALNDAGDTLTLFCVNRSLERDMDTTISVKGFAARTADAQVLRADSIYEGNDEEEPEHVVPAANSAQVKGDGVRFVFPHESVTVMTLKKK